MYGALGGGGLNKQTTNGSVPSLSLEQCPSRRPASDGISASVSPPPSTDVGEFPPHLSIWQNREIHIPRMWVEKVSTNIGEFPTLAIPRGWSPDE